MPIVSIRSAASSPYVDYIISGLIDLAATGAITVSYRQPPLALERDHVGLWFNYQPGPGQSRRVFVDLVDYPEFDFTDELDHCDDYFKRSYLESAVADLTPARAAKVRPMGLQFPAASANSTLSQEVKRRLLASQWLSQPGRSLRQLGRLLNRRVQGNAHLASPESSLLTAYECPPDSPTQPNVYYRTRVFDLNDASSPSARAQMDRLNKERVELIDTLQAALGDQFVGGLDSTPAALRDYPDHVRELPQGGTNRNAHLEASKRCLVNVTSRGVSNSTGWKFCEFLASAHCVVSEPLTYRNQYDAKPGEHYLSYTTPAQCVTACESLLQDPERAQALRNAAHRFYLTRLRPDVALACMLASLAD